MAGEKLHSSYFCKRLQTCISARHTYTQTHTYTFTDKKRRENNVLAVSLFMLTAITPVSNLTDIYNVK